MEGKNSNELKMHSYVKSFALSVRKHLPWHTTFQKRKDTFSTIYLIYYMVYKYSESPKGRIWSNLLGIKFQNHVPKVESQLSAFDYWIWKINLYKLFVKKSITGQR